MSVFSALQSHPSLVSSATCSAYSASTVLLSMSRSSLANSWQPVDRNQIHWDSRVDRATKKLQKINKRKEQRIFTKAFTSFISRSGRQTLYQRFCVGLLDLLFSLLFCFQQHWQGDSKISFHESLVLWAFLSSGNLEKSACTLLDLECSSDANCAWACTWNHG